VSAKNVSNIPEWITAPAEMLAPAIVGLLRRIPDTWQTYRPDDLSETQSQALFLLTAAGMVERCERLRLRMIDHPLVVKATVTATGEYGVVQAMEALAAGLWANWRDAYGQWKQGDTRDVAPFHFERLEPSEWRLTDQGVAARKSLADGEQNVVFDFVLKRGFFDGQPRMINGRIFRREPVRGKGALVRMEKLKGESAAPSAVEIANWGKGAQAFAKAFAGLFAMIQPPPGAIVAKTDDAATGGPRGKGKGKENLRAWTQPDLDNAIRQYRADRAASYAALRDGLKRNSPAAKKAAKEVYGRNAIARALGVKSRSMVSKSSAWIAIAQDLGLELHRGWVTGTRRTAKPGKIGLDMAVEQKSLDPADGADNAPAEAALETAERQETIRQIKHLARAGRTDKEKADNQRAADELIQRLQREECTDDEARQVVEMVLNRDE
jgi:hypothetical protein